MAALQRENIRLADLSLKRGGLKYEQIMSNVPGTEMSLLKHPVLRYKSL